VIRSIRHKGLRAFYQEGNSSKIAPAHANRLRLILARLEAAEAPQDMAYPGAGLHALRGVFDGYWAVRVSGNWRLVFRFDGGDAYDVDYLDYH
jgi:proteic killer suppression protein